MSSSSSSSSSSPRTAGRKACSFFFLILFFSLTNCNQQRAAESQLQKPDEFDEEREVKRTSVPRNCYSALTRVFLQKHMPELEEIFAIFKPIVNADGTEHVTLCSILLKRLLTLYRCEDIAGVLAYLFHLECNTWSIKTPIHNSRVLRFIFALVKEVFGYELRYDEAGDEIDIRNSDCCICEPQQGDDCAKCSAAHDARDDLHVSFGANSYFFDLINGPKSCKDMLETIEEEFDCHLPQPYGDLSSRFAN